MQTKFLPLVLIFLAAMLASVSAAAPIFPTNTQSAAFLDGNIVTLTYVKSYVCSPSISQAYYNVSAISKFTSCGIITPASVLGTLPVWIVVPSFAGFSVYGFSQLNSTTDGFATYRGNVLLTDCGAGTTRSACPDVPPYSYNPFISSVEAYYGIHNGIGGLPQGLTPMPAHDTILLTAYAGVAIPWYLIHVKVFDPNIFPNASTGKCRQVASSNLSNPTGNCLTSLDAIRRATSTLNSYVPFINANNPLWTFESNSPVQAVIVSIPNVTGISSLIYPNSNEYVFFRVNGTNYYGHEISASQDKSVIIVGIIVLLIVASASWWFLIGSKRSRGGVANQPW